MKSLKRACRRAVVNEVDGWVERKHYSNNSSTVKKEGEGADDILQKKSINRDVCIRVLLCIAADGIYYIYNGYGSCTSIVIYQRASYICHILGVAEFF
jgi:hypothetical protein